MGTILLVIHLLVAIFLVAIILLQRSEGGALDGLGGGSGASSFLSARGTGNFLTRLTAILATIFIITSISLSLYYKGHSAPQKSLIDSIEQTVPVQATEADKAPEVPAAGK
ncbi:MAG: preprotein translocase subunit SecG [Alphaproteobacteria bacterium]|nr:preprotein translocase subunit SecG [Alphaproteobacteria bacterium]